MALKLDKGKALKARLKELTEPYPRYGCPMLHNPLKGKGLAVNKKRAHRPHREMTL